jgi:hypothetical protein
MERSMRAVIRTNDVRIEFSGRGQIWNELLRPHLGGPEAPAESATPSTQPAVVPACSTSPVHLTSHRAETPAGGPPRPAPTPAPAASPAPAPYAAPRPAVAPSPSQPRTWYPPREQAPSQPRRFEPPKTSQQDYYSAEEDESDAIRVEPSSDPATLYGRLAALPGRRSERDAVLAAVWFLSKGEKEVLGEEVERHLEGFRAFPDAKVVPHLLKHVHRTKMLEFGSSQKAVRLSKKGIAYARGKLVGE